MTTSRFKPILIGIVVCLVLGSLIAIIPISPALKGMSSLNQGQGVSGLVTRLQGDQMPTIGTSRSRTAPIPISTQVWIFSGRIKSQGTRWSIREAEKHPNLVDRVRTDAEGKFFVSLPPGEYTFFAQDGSDLYLNSFSGDGSYATVQVNEGKVTETRLINTEGATF